MIGHKDFRTHTYKLINTKQQDLSKDSEFVDMDSENEEEVIPTLSWKNFVDNYQ